jgi:long-chain acyl-CoA synthetase
MIAPERYTCLGELLTDALLTYKSEIALVEASRKKEKSAYTYSDFRREGMMLARRLEDEGIGAGDRVAILMSNQPRWLIAAYAAMYRGAILVPLDYKLEADDQAALLAHAKPAALFIEYPLYRRFDQDDLAIPLIIVSEAPESATLPPQATPYESIVRGAQGALADAEGSRFVKRERGDVATIVYSSGTGGRPKGCMLTHDNYLEQYRSLGTLFPMGIGDRYFSILPTNHAIDFMVGFVGPLCGGAAIIHQRSLRPEFINWTMKEYEITHMAVVPLILEAFERRIQEKLDETTPTKRGFFEVLSSFNQILTERSPNHALSSRLLKPVHDAFGGSLKMLFCGGAFTDKTRAEFFYRLGIPVVIGYGLTEACTVATVNDLKPFRGDSVGRAVDGVEIRIDGENDEGVGEVLIRGRTVMQGYLDDEEQTAEAIRDGWLHTGDLGWLDASGHLHLVGRSKNMIVTAGGKNIYPEDIEQKLDGLPCDELAVFATNYIWPGGKLDEEVLVAVYRGDDEAELREELAERNHRLPDFKRVAGLVRWDEEFPRTASMKLKRGVLADTLRTSLDKNAVRPISS